MANQPPRFGMVSPLTTAGRATNAYSARVTFGYFEIPTRSPAS